MDDLDFDDTPLRKFCYKINNDSSIIDLPKVINWCKNIYIEQPNHPAEMHQLAIEHLDFKVKTKQLIDYLNQHA
jgi:hypothetical protein